MKTHLAQSRKFAFVYVGIVLLMLVPLGLLFSKAVQVLKPVPTHRPYPIKSLNQIIPGQSRLQGALLILGEPDSIEDSSYHPTRLFGDIFERLPDYKVYIFSERQGWHKTELWIQKRGFEQIVVAVLRFLPTNIRDFANNPSLEDFVMYGRPDKVLWSSSCYFRYLIWLNEGIAVESGSQLYISENGMRKSYAWDEIPVYTIFLFELMNSKDIIDITKWPWPNNGSVWNPPDTEWSPCTEDRAPRDSFDWKNLPTPLP